MITTHGCPTCTCQMTRAASPGQSGWRAPTPSTAPRLWPAWDAALDRLAREERVSRVELVSAMLAASDILEKTAANTLRSAERAGLLSVKRDGSGMLWYSRLDLFPDVNEFGFTAAQQARREELAGER